MFSSRRNLALGVFLAAAAVSTTTVVDAASSGGVRGQKRQHQPKDKHNYRVRSLQENTVDLFFPELLAEDAGIAEDAGNEKIAEDAGNKKKDDKKKDDKDKDEKSKDEKDEKSKDNNGGGGNGNGGGGGGDDRQQDEPCGDIDCAVTVDKPVMVQECPNELAALNNCLRTKEDGTVYVGGVPRQTWCPQRVNAAVAGSVACGTDAAQACDVFTTYGRNVNDPCYYCEDLTKKYASCKIATARTTQAISCPMPLSLEPDAATCQWVPSTNNVVVPAPAPTPGAVPSPTGGNNIPAPTPGANPQPVLPPICVEPENLPEPTGGVNVVPDRNSPTTGSCVDLSGQLDTCLASDPSTLMACKTCLIDTAMLATGCSKGSGTLCALLSVCRNSASCNGNPGGAFETCWPIAHELAKCEMKSFCSSTDMTACVA